jgi:hypothetical protein
VGLVELLEAYCVRLRPDVQSRVTCHVKRARLTNLNIFKKPIPKMENQFPYLYFASCVAALPWKKSMVGGVPREACTLVDVRSSVVALRKPMVTNRTLAFAHEHDIHRAFPNANVVGSLILDKRNEGKGESYGVESKR